METQLRFECFLTKNGNQIISTWILHKDKTDLRQLVEFEHATVVDHQPIPTSISFFCYEDLNFKVGHMLY